MNEGVVEETFEMSDSSTSAAGAGMLQPFRLNLFANDVGMV